MRHRIVTISFQPANQSIVSVAQPRRLFCDGIHHGLKIAGRARNHAQNVAGGSGGHNVLGVFNAGATQTQPYLITNCTVQIDLSGGSVGHVLAYYEAQRAHEVVGDVHEVFALEGVGRLADPLGLDIDGDSRQHRPDDGAQRLFDPLCEKVSHVRPDCRGEPTRPP